MKPDPILDIPGIEQWGIDVGIFAFMNTKWGWPAAEIVHFFGLCLLMGTIGAFDLRVLGLGKGVPLKALHRLIPFGVMGFAMCVATGFLFVVSAPSQYLHNPAYLVKMALMALAGVNMVVFYLVGAKAAYAVGADETPARWVRVFAFVSLAAWIGVIVCGRVITFFRPPAYYWCFWC